jgi:hypothetical protein
MRLPRPVLAGLAVLLLLLLGASPALAQPARPAHLTRGFEFGFYFNQNAFDDSALLDDEVGFGARFGYLVTPDHELEFLFDGVGTHDTPDPGDHVDVSNFQMAYVYNFTRSGVVPYITAGVGFLSADHDFKGTETDFLYSFGGGVRFFLAHTFYVRFEARQNLWTGDGQVFFQDDHLSMFNVDFGIGWRFPIYP